MKILVIDEEKDLCELLKLFLEEQGYQVQITTNAREALGLCEQVHFDLILKDMQCEQSKREPNLTFRQRLPKSKIILMCSRKERLDECLEKVLSQEIQAILEKPFELEVLSQTLERAIQSKNLI